MLSDKRRWFRFSFRTLLVVVTLLCLFLGQTAYIARHRTAAIEAIRAAGGQLDFVMQAADQFSPVQRWYLSLWGDSYWKSVRFVRLGERPVGDEILVQLEWLPEVFELDLLHTQITDEGLRHLRGSQGLNIFFSPERESPTRASSKSATCRNLGI